MIDHGEILLIDDDEDDLSIYVEAFETMSISVTTFGSGVAFLDYIKTSQKKIFFILCDINMPIMNGIELRKLIWDDPNLRVKARPFLFHSTAGDVGNVTAAYLLPVQGYFLKGASFEGVKQQLEIIVEYFSRMTTDPDTH